MLERVAFAVLLLWVALAPIPLGSVPEAEVEKEGAFADFLDAGGGYAVFRLLGYTAVGLAAAAALARRRDPLAPDRGYRLMLCLLFGLVLLGLFQMVPLPAAIRAVVAPGSTGSELRIFGDAAPAVRPVSIEVGLTAAAVVRYALLAFAVVAVLVAARGTRRAWTLLAVVAGTAAAVAGYGLVETIWLQDGVLGFRKTDPGGGVTGTFLYRGNFAALAAAGLGVAAAGLVAARRYRRPLPGALAAIAIALLAAGLVLSRSRAGLGAGALALAAAFFAAARSRRIRIAGVVAVLLAAVAAGALSGSIRERFKYFSGPASRGFLDIRVAAWDSTLDLAADRPVLGAGLGTYRRAIHMTQSDWIPEELWFAHSDPLNLLAEGGAVGLLLGGAAVAIGLFLAWRRARREEGGEIGAACFGGLAGLTAMALIDFPLQIPATGLVFVVLLSIPGAADMAVRRNSGRGRWLPGLALAGTAGLLALTVAGYLGDFDRRDEPGRTARAAALLAERKPKEALELLEAERDEKPYEAATRYWLARALFATGEFDEARGELRVARAVAHGRSDLLFSIGSMAYRLDPAGDLATGAFREAAALDPHVHPRLLNALPPDLWPAITPDRDDARARLADAAEREIAALWSADARERSEEALATLRCLYRAIGHEPAGRAAFEERGLSFDE